ncbi:hypothetical protein Mal15_01470 [Stieleria maiorica]|uniref:Uncharacterized protein n=1 Tax=Stieleria maiorica TaxID=2795974 RepID=A0A5B9M4R2_9BACT|nr:hypothetical protein Mal15_01470 [Stieleria maiorica]
MAHHRMHHRLPSNDAKEMLGLWAEPFEAFNRRVPRLSTGYVAWRRIGLGRSPNTFPTWSTGGRVD